MENDKIVQAINEILLAREFEEMLKPFSDFCIENLKLEDTFGVISYIEEDKNVTAIYFKKNEDKRIADIRDATKVREWLNSLDI